MKSLELTLHRCSAPCKNGKPCNKFVKAEGDRCPRHNPNLTTKGFKQPQPKIESIQDIITAQAEMLSRLMVKEDLTSKDFSSFAQLSSAFVRNKSDLELSKRLDAVEKTMQSQQ